MMKAHERFNPGWKDQRKRELIAFRATPELAEQLKNHAREGSLSDFVREACERALR